MSRSNSGNNDSSGNPSSDKRALRQRMSRDLQLRGMAKRTHDGYLREVRKLACFYNTPPDQLTEQQVGEYLLYLINDCNFAPGTLGVAYSGIKFFYTFTEPRDWEVLRKLRRPKQKTLPAVLTIDEVHRIIGTITQHRNAAYFWTIYSLGLRLEEGLNLQVGDIDSGRMMVHVHRGKGAKDRYLPLPQSTLVILRDYWATPTNLRSVPASQVALPSHRAQQENRLDHFGANGGDDGTRLSEACRRETRAAKEDFASHLSA